MDKFEFVEMLSNIQSLDDADDTFENYQKKLCTYSFTKKELVAMKKKQLEAIGRFVGLFGWWYMNKVELINELLKLQ